MANFLDYVKGVASKGVSTLGSTAKTLANITPENSVGHVISYQLGKERGISEAIAPKPSTTGGNVGGTPDTGTVYSGADSGAYSDPYAQGGGGGGGGGYAYDPYAAQAAKLKTDIQQKIQAYKSVYDSLFGDIDNSVKSQLDSGNSEYDRQLNDLNTAFGKTQAQQGQIYAARGLGSSSYNIDAQNEAANTYQTNVDAINKARQDYQANLGKFAATNKASLGANRSAFDNLDLNSYGASDLASLNSNLDQSLASANQQRASLMTNPQYMGELQKIAPTQNQGTAQLASKLQTLITSSAPLFAKKQIAQGLIKSANLTDKNAQDYWNNYFQQLISQNGQTAPTQGA